MQRIGLAITLLAAVACGTDRPSYYRALEIDPATRAVTFGPRMPAPDAGTYYFRFDDARNRPGVTLIERDQAGAMRCREHLALEADHRLSSRSKIRELWRGPYGQLLGQLSYYYGPEYQEAGVGFLVLPNASGHCVERPHPADPPSPEPAMKPDAIDLALVFATDSGFRFSIGTYSGAGWLQAVTTGRARRTSANPDSVRPEAVGTSFLSQPPDSSLTRGLPARVDLASLGRTVLPAGEPPLWVLIDVIYDRGQLVRQDADSAGTRQSVRWIRFPPTYSDSVLGEIDRRRTFGRSPRVSPSR
jgi:hypothetical protein